MSYTESAIGFACADERLIGIVSAPDEAMPAARTGVIIIVGGPQYRAGSHRLFVSLARSLATAGFAVLRFDHRGIGDSSGEPRSFESIGDDIAAAISALQARRPGLERFVLWGLCDAASAALLYVEARNDDRLSGLCLLNPWVRSEQSLARTHVKHYYGQRLLQRAFWQKLLSGRVGFAALAGFVGSLRQAAGPRGKASDARAALPYQSRMAAGWRGFPGRILLLISGQDLTAKEFISMAEADPNWAGCLKSTRLTLREMPDADHTLSAPSCSAAVERYVIEWLSELTGTHDEA